MMYLNGVEVPTSSIDEVRIYIRNTSPGDVVDMDVKPGLKFRAAFASFKQYHKKSPAIIKTKIIGDKVRIWRVA